MPSKKPASKPTSSRKQQSKERKRPDRASHHKLLIDEAFVKRLERLIEIRHMDAALNLFNKYREAIFRLPKSNAHAARLADCCARLLDRSRGHLAELKDFLMAFDPHRPNLSVSDEARLERANGVVEFHEDRPEEALRSFEDVLGSAQRNGLHELVPESKYYLGRTYNRLGKYKEALTHLQEAKKLTRAERALARIEMVEAWVLFVTGELKEALKVLGTAEARFKKTGILQRDHIEHCNVLSFYARSAAQAGDFGQAIELFKSAGAKFKQGNARHHFYARILTHLAHTKMQLARQLEEKSGIGTSMGQRQKLRNQIEQCWEESWENLNAAENMYRELAGRQGGLAAVHTFKGEFYLNKGDYVNARVQVREALKISNAKDPVARTHALVLRSEIELGEGNAPSAHECARQALTLALGIGRRRLIARTQLMLGLTFLRPPFANLEDAQQCLREAGKHMQEHDKDYLRWEYERLDQELVNASTQKKRIVEVTESDVLAKGLTPILKDVEKRIVEAALRLMGGSKNKAAKVLRVNRSRIRRALGK